MKTKLLYFLLGIVLVWFGSCTREDFIVNTPDFGDNALLVSSSVVPLPQKAGGSSSVMKNMEGVYDVISGQSFFGATVVAKRSGKFVSTKDSRNKERFSLFAGINKGFLVLNAGLQPDSTIIFEGYWRFGVNLQTGLVRLTVAPNEGGRRIVKNSPADTSLILRGKLSYGSVDPNQSFELRYRRHFADSTNTFQLYVDRGGSRNSDAPVASELSLNILRQAEQFGANGVEIDIRLTRDKVPILFHDEEFSTRTVNSDYLIGPVSNYPLAHIRALGTLKDGQAIPTLDEALDVIVHQTTLTYVWLDIKTPDLVPYVIPLQLKYQAEANNPSNPNRHTMQFYLDLPDNETIQQYLDHPDHSKAPSICELDPSDVTRAGASAWAPRWTRGDLKDEASSLIAQGKKVVYWTIDEPEFINVFLNNDVKKRRNFNGILTHYPSVVAFEYYMRH